MNDLVVLAEVHREHGDAEDLVALSVRLASTPFGPLLERHGASDRELAALVSDAMGT